MSAAGADRPTSKVVDRSQAIRRRQGGPERALEYLYIFRLVVVGLALVGAAIAWLEQVPWLLAACVCIGVGELLESSYYIGVLRWGRQVGPDPRVEVDLQASDVATIRTSSPP